MPIYDSEDIVIGLDQIPERVVSLVPSTTETLIKFGLGNKLVGITDYCPPVDVMIGKPERVGGTRSPDIDKILQLRSDLVIANKEENSQEAVKSLDEADIRIWLTFPKTVDEAIEDLWITARIFHQERHLASNIETLQRSLEWTRLATVEQSHPRYFCPIWVGENTDWWMTFNQYTYAHDILACCGGVNVFSERDEQKIANLLAETPAVVAGEIYFIDGRLISWHGTHIAEAITTLPAYFQGDARSGID
jgi:iron complex transport system substrate-binding protein